MKKTLTLFCCFFALSLGTGCGILHPGKDPSNFDSRRKTSFDHFGTVCFAAVFDDFSEAAAAERFEATWQEIDDMLTDLENAVSVAKVGSDIFRFNAAKYGERIAIRPITAKIASAAMEMHTLSGGAYNPAVANLVDLWGFSPRFRKKDSDGDRMPYDRTRNADGGFNLPDRRYIEAFKKLSDFSGVVLSGNETDGYFLTKSVKDTEVDGIFYSLSIDFGGIAKGYGADRAAEILRKYGYEYGYVNLGLSSLRLLKRNVSDKGALERNMWAIGMPNPDNRTEDFLSIFGKDTGVSTSGTYDLRYSIGGREYSHMIDPKTGEPTRSDIVSVTVLGKNAAYDDALSTALCIMGAEKAKAFIRDRMEGYRVMCLIKNGERLETFTNMKAGDFAINSPH